MLECWRSGWRKMMTFELKKRWRIARIGMKTRKTVVVVVAGT